MTENLSFRSAELDDLRRIIELLAADPLGQQRERFEEPLPRNYREAFNAIHADSNHTLLIAEREGELLGVLQLSLIPNLTYQGSWRAQIEGVRVAEAARGQGVGRRLVEEALARSRRAGCRLVQLTTDKTRPKALRFYESLGFVSSHEGMKLHLLDG